MEYEDVNQNSYFFYSKLYTIKHNIPYFLLYINQKIKEIPNDMYFPYFKITQI